jgi:CheY-like chemotaxis protein
MAKVRNFGGARADKDAMQPREIASVLTQDRIAFTSERDWAARKNLHALADAYVMDVTAHGVAQASRTLGPDLWIIHDDKALEIAWLARGWAGVVAIVNRTTREMTDARGRFMLVPNLDKRTITKLRRRAREVLLESLEGSTPYEECSLQTKERMLRGALVLAQGSVTKAAALLGMSRQLCQMHLQKLDTAFGEPRAKFLPREPTSGVMARVRARPKILLAEDDPAIARCVARILECAGECVIVHTASALAEHLATETWDAIVLDIHLRGGSGLELLEQARAEGCRSAVVVLTGDYRKSYQDVAERLGIEAFLSKGVEPEIDPITTDNLLFRVGACLLRP